MALRESDADVHPVWQADILTRCSWVARWISDGYTAAPCARFLFHCPRRTSASSTLRRAKRVRRAVRFSAGLRLRRRIVYAGRLTTLRSAECSPDCFAWPRGAPQYRLRRRSRPAIEDAADRSRDRRFRRLQMAHPGCRRIRCTRGQGAPRRSHGGESDASSSLLFFTTRSGTFSSSAAPDRRRSKPPTH